MLLYEHEGKALLGHFGLDVPNGAVWPDLPPGDGPFMVKAETLEGKRGKRGLIRTAADPQQCKQHAEALLAATVDDVTVHKVYIEERIQIADELYVAVMIDRDLRLPVVLASPHGGIDVEESPKEDLVRLPVDPIFGLRPFAVRHLVKSLRVPAELESVVGETIMSLYKAFRSTDAHLIEINPLAITADGHVVPVDVKMQLDESANFRRPNRPEDTRGHTPFEAECRRLGVAGIEMDGDAAILVSGAGLMMATVDLLSEARVDVGAAVDLGGMVFAEPEVLGQVVQTVRELAPRVYFVNAFMQLASCMPLALGVAEAVRGGLPANQVIVRLRGPEGEEARQLLQELGVKVISELREAVELLRSLQR